MLITFTVTDQKITHDLTQSLVAGSSGIVKALFNFDETWDELNKVVVFSNSSCSKPYPVKYEGEQIDIPACILQAGKLYVSCVGFGDTATRKTTQAWDIQQAITVQKCGDMGSCELLRNLVQATGSNGVDEDSVATDDEVAEMLAGVFGTSGTGSGDDSGSTDSGSTTVDDEEVATDDEVATMLAAVFNS